MTSADFRTCAEKKGPTQGGQLRADVKATEVVNWLKAEFAPGHGHVMAIYALLKGALPRKATEPPRLLGWEQLDGLRWNRDAPGSGVFRVAQERLDCMHALVSDAACA